MIGSVFYLHLYTCSTTVLLLVDDISLGTWHELGTSLGDILCRLVKSQSDTQIVRAGSKGETYFGSQGSRSSAIKVTIKFAILGNHLFDLELGEDRLSCVVFQDPRLCLVVQHPKHTCTRFNWKKLQFEPLTFSQGRTACFRDMHAIYTMFEVVQDSTSTKAH